MEPWMANSFDYIIKGNANVSRDTRIYDNTILRFARYLSLLNGGLIDFWIMEEFLTALAMAFRHSIMRVLGE